jgi:hypothetical protein
MGDGKLQIDQRVDRVEAAIMLLAQEGYSQEVVNKIEATLKGDESSPWVAAQES